MKAIKEDASTLKAERDSLFRELQGVTEMLAQVLKVTGPVEVTKESLAQGLDPDVGIMIDDDQLQEKFIFRLGKNDDES